MTSQQKRIWGWMFFDWAQQPYFTLGLTFIFGPYFAFVAAQYFITTGLEVEAAKAQSQSLWTLGQTIAGIIIAITAPVLGAWADASGRKMVWIAAFSVVYVICAALLWGLLPDGTGLMFTLVVFWIGFIAAESALNINNAMLPGLAEDAQIGRISGSGAAFGYWGGVLSLILMLLIAENESGKTLIGMAPPFGLNPDLREGTRAVGPFIAIWCVIFILPFLLWNREPRMPARRVSLAEIWAGVVLTIRDCFKRRSLGSFMLSSMLYRDALNALYSFGGVYAALVLGWQTIQIGVFGIVAAIAAAIVTYIGGLYDQKLGPMPVIKVSCAALVVVSVIVVGMSRQALFGFHLPEGSTIPDIIFYLCGAAIGGAGGAIYSASRTMMIRHTHPDRPGEAFGLFALTGRATAFLAPALISLFTYTTGNVQLGFLPVIGLFLIGLFLLRYVNKDGDRAQWSAS